MELLKRLQEDVKTAMKAGAKERLSVIRMLLSDVKIIDLAPKPITAEETVAAYAKKLRKSQEEYRKLGKADEVAKLQSELEVVEEYLPKKASRDKTEELVDAFLAGHPYTERQLGQAMGAFMKAHGTAVDAGIASAILRQKLAGK